MVSCALMRHQQQFGLRLFLGVVVRDMQEVFLWMIQGCSTVPSTPNLLTLALAASVQLTKKLTLSLQQTSSREAKIKRMDQANFTKRQQIMSSRLLLLLHTFSHHVKCNANYIFGVESFPFSYFFLSVMLLVTRKNWDKSKKNISGSKHSNNFNIYFVFFPTYLLYHEYYIYFTFSRH